MTSLLVLSDGTLLSGGEDGYLASWDIMNKCSLPKVSLSRSSLSSQFE